MTTKYIPNPTESLSVVKRTILGKETIAEIDNLVNQYNQLFIELQQTQNERDNLRNEIIEITLSENTEREELENEVKRLTDELAKYQTKTPTELFNETVENSDEPFFLLIASNPKMPEGMKIDPMWNDKFCEYLVKQGITGTVQEEVVQKWLIVLCEQLIMSIETQSIESNTQSTGTEYV